MPQLIPLPKIRRFVAQDLKISRWEDVQPYFEQLLAQDVSTLSALQNWLQQRSELESVLDEDLAWRYIRMTCDTANEAHRQAYEFFIGEIFPQMAPYDDQLNRQLLGSAAIDQITEPAFLLYKRRVEGAIRLYRAENIALQAEQKQLESAYGALIGAMSITHEGAELTLPQAAQLLKAPDRVLRQQVWQKISDRRQQDQAQLDELFSKLIALRHQIAVNAGFDSYTAYRFVELGRFDYTEQDCLDFHDTIRALVVPLKAQFDADRVQALGLPSLRPWDTKAEPADKPALRPFNDEADLIAKSIEAFAQIDPYFGDCLYSMQQMGHFDLSSRKGKAPGGYNYPLMESGAPFIFMNAAGSMEDLETMMHEGGHAVHSFLTKDLQLSAYKALPSETAELASMSMELMSMTQYPLFFATEIEQKRARYEQIQRAVTVLPWIAAIDAFQHWIYAHPQHLIAERAQKWAEIFTAYGSPEVDWSGLEDRLPMQWQAQLHLFEVPFYYIEYGFAQLGALGVWKNFVADPQQAVAQYKQALSLGHTASIPEVYAAAGVKFDFSKTYLADLLAFVKEQLLILKSS
ncbi:MAG: M3 family oligoendopeptidase [Sphingobacteriaceae bacterium]|nr:M3 family oligoendopeptidase [Sphingobacteriaceae bacterium]